MTHLNCYLIAFMPLLGALIAGFYGKIIGRKLTHTVTILAMFVSCFYAGELALGFYLSEQAPFEMVLYRFASLGTLNLEVGFYLDSLTALMAFVVSFVSLMVHVYTIGYMEEDSGYTRFFSYISAFTFGMLMLVMSNNCLQLFFGWEAVGLMSYLLIGFWYERESAIFANLKAFLVNRVGDFGFLLGIALIYKLFNTLNYLEIFQKIPEVMALNPTVEIFFGQTWSAMTVLCICLFIGAMGKSAQIPLHVWLPDSMEGPTPISALIHAATMVTAGVFMVARFSPLFELSEVALSFVLVIGTLTCVLMGILGIVQSDIKRIIAYSTLSQLGYMVVALGVSAYSVGVFHLVTHAFFKALLFLGAGSVIIGMHHEQNIWKMGGLYKRMPITYICMLIGSLAIIGFPFFSGFYSKDLIIMAANASNLPFGQFAYYGVLGSVFVTAFYSFRLFFVVFHTNERMDAHTKSHIHESPMVVWLPLVILAIFSLISGYVFVGDVLGNYFGSAISDHHQTMAHLREHFEHGGRVGMALHGFMSLPFVLAISGVIAAWLCYVAFPKVPALLSQKLKIVHQVLLNKYGFDSFNESILMPFTKGTGQICATTDTCVVDGVLSGGTSKGVGILAGWAKNIQTGYIYQYSAVFLLGLTGFIIWLLVNSA